MIGLARLLIKVAEFLKSRFPEKISAESVLADIELLKRERIQLGIFVENFKDSIHQIEELANNLELLTSEVKSLKSQMNLKTIGSRVMPNNMTAFATKLPPVQPALGTAGVNK